MNFFNKNNQRKTRQRRKVRRLRKTQRRRNPVLKVMDDTEFKQNHNINKTNTNNVSMICSPAVLTNRGNSKWGKRVEGSCYTDKVLLKIRDEYNRGKNTEKGFVPIKTSNPPEIWRELRDRLTSCKKEDCWLNEIEDTQLKKQLDRFIFAPDKPPEWTKNPNEWLSNFDILGVLEQYEQAYPEFEFIGPSPIDFDTKINSKCVEEELCKIDFAKLAGPENKRKIGVVFNLDKHDQSGSHWVALFVDVDDELVFYFDSANNGTPSQIQTLIDRLQDQIAEKTGHKYNFYRNKITHQHNNTECGVYCLFFIVTMLTKKTEMKENMGLQERLDLFMKHRIPDKYVEKYRNRYFN